jgi:hypothetical protein
MKRKISILAGVFILVIAILAALPLVFKDKLLSKVKTTLNNQLNAKIDFREFSLSVFSHFPKVEMEIRGLSLVGAGEFASDTLFCAESISTDISITQMISSKGIELKSLIIKAPKINLISDKTGKVNWDVTKATTGKVVENGTSPASSNDFTMKLNDIQVENMSLKYTDLAMPMNLWLKNTSIRSSGRVEGATTSFDLKGEANEFIFEYDSVKYISKTRLKAESLLKADFDKMNFAFEKGKLWINNLPLVLSGTFAMPNDSMFFDLGFKSEKSDFATILSLIPESYQKYIEKAEIKGNAEFNGKVKGLYYNEIYPAIDIVLSAENGSFKYQGLPESVQDIQVSAQISKPEGDLNLLKVNVEKAHASVRNNPVDVRLQVTEPMTDPNIDASFAGTIDFASLKQALPVDSLDITGVLKASMQMTGRMSSIEKQEYEKFKSNGEASIQNFRIQGKQLTQAVEISGGKIKASTRQIIIDQLNLKIGQSDMSLMGNVADYLAYMFKNGILKGSFSLQSDFMNFTELMNIQKREKAGSDSKVQVKSPNSPSLPDSITAFQVPKNLDLVFQSAIQKAVYDKMPVNHIVGQVKVKDQRIDLTNLSMEMLQGKLAVNGSYIGNKENKPAFDFKIDIQNMDIPTAYQSLSTFRHYLPVAARSQGKFSTQFGLSGILNEKMNIVPTSLNGNGLFNGRNLMIVDSPLFDQIRGIIKKEKLKNVKIDDFTAKFQFENGQLNLNPFKTTVADQQATIYGSLSASREINLNLDFLVNREDLGADINKGLDILPGSQNIKMIDASVILKGPVTKPTVSLDLSKARAQIEQQVKKASVDDIKESVKKLGNELKKLFK